VKNRSREPSFTAEFRWEPASGSAEAINAAEQSDCDDLLYYCYGWAEQSLFDAAGNHYQKPIC
jgi:hypothetical protein